MADQSRALDAAHPLTLTFADLLHDFNHRHLDRIPAGFRRVMMTLPDAVREIAAGTAALPRYWRSAPELGLALLLAYEGDDAALSFLEGPVGAPAAAQFGDWIAYGLLGPRLRTDPRFVAVLARRAIPRP